jgi:hypothetical protein
VQVQHPEETRAGRDRPRAVVDADGRVDRVGAGSITATESGGTLTAAGGLSRAASAIAIALTAARAATPSSAGARADRGRGSRAARAPVPSAGS